MTELALLATAVRQQRQHLDKLAGEAIRVAREGKAAQACVTQLRASYELHEKAAAVLNAIGEQAQASAQAQVEGLVTRALQVIFGENLSFHLVQTVKANRTEVEFVLRSTYDGESMDTPVMEARGGGMAAVVGFVLRLVVLLLTPRARRFLALDESFWAVSASYEPRVAEFLHEVAYQADVQILLLTHSTAYADLADQRYRLVLGGGGITEVHEGESE